MLWFGTVVVIILAQLKQGWNEWGFRITVILSLGANLVVAIVSGTRRRSTRPGLWWGFLGLAAQFSLWGAYQLAEVASTNAIGSLSLCGTDASEEEQQVAAFWGLFLLLHLGGPDNLTAYALEDNKISKRKWIELAFQILGMCYTIYDNTHRGARSWGLLLAAYVLMILAGSVRYVERAMAQIKANLDKMQEEASSSGSSSKDDAKMAYLKFRIEKEIKRPGRSLSDREALLLAQDLFPVWRHALVDSSVDPDSKRQQASEAMLTSPEWDWESRCQVAEMELSLIYEFLYTKAILAHSWTWRYYLIRLLSPLSTAAAAFLFSSWLLHPDDNGGRRVVRGSFVGITYALLTVTFLMDVAWLLRAIGSTWAYAYVRELTAGAGTRWWCRLHRIVVCLDPWQLLCRDPVSRRRWSGTIGRYNLLRECSATCPEWWPVSMAGAGDDDDKPHEIWFRCKLPQCVKRLLFKRVTEILQQAIDKQKQKDDKSKNKDEDKYKKMYSRKNIRTCWGHKAFRIADVEVKENIKENIEENRKKTEPPPAEGNARPSDVSRKKTKPSSEESTIFGKEFEEDVLLWHIATCMLLPHIRRRGTPHTCAIEVLSEYMMFLVAVRRQMLPGLVLHSQLQLTRKALIGEVWPKREQFKEELCREGFMMDNNEDKLAMLLRLVSTNLPPPDEMDQWKTSIPIKGTEGTGLLANAVDLYFILSGDSSRGDTRPQPKLDGKMLEFIFKVWVDKLVYAAVRCSREAHAAQLSAGGELTTVLWMLIQHAGPFCMGKANNIYLSLKQRAKDDEKAKKKSEEKKKPEEKKPAEEKKADDKPPRPSPPPMMPPPTTMPPPMLPLSPPYSPCPVCPPCYHPSYPPVCPPCYNPSCPPVCPWYPQCPPQHEKPAREEDDEHEDSSSDEDSEE